MERRRRSRREAEVEPPALPFPEEFQPRLPIALACSLCLQTCSLRCVCCAAGSLIVNNQSCGNFFASSLVTLTARGESSGPSMAPSETFLRLQELGRKSREAGSAVDAAALPSASVLEREFGLFDPTRAGCLPTVDATTGAVSCACAGCERWKRYITGTLGEGWPTFPQYEVITADYVTQLARYLRRRRLEILGADEPRPLRVLELGAGDGRLTRHLREHLDGHGIEVYATDDHSLGLAKGDAKGGHHGVVAADALDAVSQCGFSREPTTAVSSSSSSSSRARATSRWCAGSPWAWTGPPPSARPRRFRSTCWSERWTTASAATHARRGGFESTTGDSGDGGGGEGTSEGDLDVAYASDGWSRVDVTEELGGRQICRTDERWLMGRRSRTTSFRRMDVDAAGVPGKS